MKIKIDLIEFSAAQYLPSEFGNCHNLHGHNYQIRNLVIDEEKIINFRIFKELIDKFDHCIIVPERDFEYWKDLEYLPINKLCHLKFVTIPYSMVTAEFLADHIRKEMLKIEDVTEVHFDLYETLNCGAQV
jgi:6-pyruvoyl-tetrahydropterin synthase